MAYRRVVPFRIAPPPSPLRYDDVDDAEEEESESGTDLVYDSYNSNADLEPLTAINPPQRLQLEEEEANEEGVKNEEEKEKENVEVRLGGGVVLPTCPVCMETWTSEGPHRVCCIPCGHVYGRLCLEEWLRKCRNKGKCPQCNKKFNLKQITNLFAPKILVPSDDLEKEVTSLREKIKLLASERARLHEEIHKQRHDHCVILGDILRDVQQRTMHDAARLNEVRVQMSRWGTHIKAMEKQVCHCRFSGEYGYYPGSSSGPYLRKGAANRRTDLV